MKVVIPCKSKEELQRIESALTKYGFSHRSIETQNPAVMHHIDVIYEQEQKQLFFEALNVAGISDEEFIQRLSDHIKQLMKNQNT